MKLTWSFYSYLSSLKRWTVWYTDWYSIHNPSFKSPSCVGWVSRDPPALQTIEKNCILHDWKADLSFDSSPAAHFSSHVIQSVSFPCSGLHSVTGQRIYQHLKVGGRPCWNKPPWVAWTRSLLAAVSWEKDRQKLLNVAWSHSAHVIKSTHLTTHTRSY